MRQYFQPFIDDLVSTHGKNLVSVILYGSAAVGETVPTHATHNILIALDKIGPADLRNAQACVREWVRLGNPVPVYFTMSELATASDVFPIEFHQMTLAHKVLYGPDLLAGIAVDDANLRHQTEYELRSKLIQLRRHYIPASTTAEGIVRLMSDSLPSFVALFGAVLLLKGIDPPVTKADVIAATEAAVGVDAGVFNRIIQLRQDRSTIRMEENSANELFAEYLEQIKRVIDAVDLIEK
jgi:hypothetical protein